MSSKKGQPFPFVVIAIVLGWTVFKQFDIENMKFEKPVLAVVYILTFLMTIYFLVKNLKEK